MSEARLVDCIDTIQEILADDARQDDPTLLILVDLLHAELRRRALVLQGPPEGECVENAAEFADVLTEALTLHTIPDALPERWQAHPRLIELYELIVEWRRLALALSRGDLSYVTTGRGFCIGTLKALQANLRHLSWQTEQIAHGDFTQRVAFLGDFSVAFNQMVQELADARDQLLREREALQREIAERERLEEELRILSFFDPLTGLHNRRYFEAELERLKSGRHYPVSIIIADVDGLKLTNDTLGHTAGDLLLARAGAVLRKAVRGEDIVARIGGDEFAVLLPDTPAETTAYVLHRIEDCLNAANADSTNPPLGISVGVATNLDHEPLEATVIAADHAMYAAKEQRHAGRVTT